MDLCELWRKFYWPIEKDIFIFHLYFQEGIVKEPSNRPCHYRSRVSSWWVACWYKNLIIIIRGSPDMNEQITGISFHHNQKNTIIKRWNINNSITLNTLMGQKDIDQEKVWQAVCSNIQFSSFIQHSTIFIQGSTPYSTFNPLFNIQHLIQHSTPPPPGFLPFCRCHPTVGPVSCRPHSRTQTLFFLTKNQRLWETLQPEARILWPRHQRACSSSWALDYLTAHIRYVTEEISGNLWLEFEENRTNFSCRKDSLNIEIPQPGDNLWFESDQTTTNPTPNRSIFYWHYVSRSANQIK